MARLLVAELRSVDLGACVAFEGDLYVPLSLRIDRPGVARRFPFRMRWRGRGSGRRDEILEVWLDEERVIRHVSFVGEVQRANAGLLGRGTLREDVVVQVDEQTIEAHERNVGTDARLVFFEGPTESTLELRFVDGGNARLTAHRTTMMKPRGPFWRAFAWTIDGGRRDGGVPGVRADVAVVNRWPGPNVRDSR